MRPLFLQELYEGRMYVSPTLSSQWLLKGEGRGTTKIAFDVEYDPAQLVTRFLCQQFRRQADVEEDLPVLEPMVLSPRISDQGWCKYPAKVCKRLRRLPVEWMCVRDILELG